MAAERARSAVKGALGGSNLSCQDDSDWGRRRTGLTFRASTNACGCNGNGGGGAGRGGYGHAGQACEE